MSDVFGFLLGAGLVVVLIIIGRVVLDAMADPVGTAARRARNREDRERARRERDARRSR